MAEMVTVAVDGMGGDNGAEATVKGVCEALSRDKNIRVRLCGTRDVMEKELAKYDYDSDRLELVPTTEEVIVDASPVMEIQKKKDSSMVVGMKMVKTGEADAFVSAGSSGAVLVGGQVLVGRMKGVSRAPLAPIIPNMKGVAMLIDCGANMDAKPEQLLQFARMGSIYMKNIVGVKNPRVGLVNVGVEEEKGNRLVKEAYPLLKSDESINFIGNIEARDIPMGVCDVIVCDAFVGNTILKLSEGMAIAMVKMIKQEVYKSTRTKIGALLMKPALKNVMKRFSTKEYGGAPLLGLNGLVVKIHGNSTYMEMRNAIIQCADFTRSGIREKFAEVFSDSERKKDEQ